MGRLHSSPILSVIIPAYNEADRILPYIRQTTAYLSRRGQPYEVLVVDDGSRDETAARVNAFAAQATAVRLIQLPVNAGKGAAVRVGMLEARGRFRLMADADGATPIWECEQLEAGIRGGADLAIASRVLALRDHRFRVKARWHRSLLGNLFNAVARRLLIERIADTQCGFKLFRAGVARDLFSLTHVNGYGFDLELLYVARRRGYRIQEMPVNWTDQPGSKVRLARDGYRMFLDVLAVRRYEAQGLYGPPIRPIHDAFESRIPSLAFPHQTSRVSRDSSGATV